MAKNPGQRRKLHGECGNWEPAGIRTKGAMGACPQGEEELVFCTMFVYASSYFLQLPSGGEGEPCRTGWTGWPGLWG